VNIEEYRNFCLSLPATSESFPFDEKVLVFKVENKMFALTNVDQYTSINLKCEPERAIELREQYPSVRPGFHMSKKHWNTINLDGSISNKLLEEWILHSYDRVVQTLPKKVREGLKEKSKTMNKQSKN